MLKDFILSGNLLSQEHLKEDIENLANFDCQGNKRTEDSIAIISSFIMEKVIRDFKEAIKSMQPDEIEKTQKELAKIFTGIDGREIMNIKASSAFRRGFSHQTAKAKRNNEKAPSKQLFDLYHQLTLRKIAMGIPILGKIDVSYDTDAVEQYRRNLEDGKRVIDIEFEALKRSDKDSIGLAKSIYQKLDRNFSTSPWGKSYAIKLQEYREQKLREVHTTLSVNPPPVSAGERLEPPKRIIVNPPGGVRESLVPSKEEWIRRCQECYKASQNVSINERSQMKNEIEKMVKMARRDFSLKTQEDQNVKEH